MRESSKLDKTKLPVDTYEKWLGTQTKHRGKASGSATPPPDSYEIWVSKMAEAKMKATRST